MLDDAVDGAEAAEAAPAAGGAEPPGNGEVAREIYLGGYHPSGRPGTAYARDIRAGLRNGPRGGGVLQVSAVVVANGAGQVLAGFNQKRQVWDVPQGVVERGEGPADAAARELEEETGLAALPEQLELLGQFNHATPGFAVGWETFLYCVRDPCLRVDGARNAEPAKCSWLAWYAPCQLPSPRGLSLRVALALMGLTP